MFSCMLTTVSYPQVFCLPHVHFQEGARSLGVQPAWA